MQEGGADKSKNKIYSFADSEMLAPGGSVVRKSVLFRFSRRRVVSSDHSIFDNLCVGHWPLYATCDSVHDEERCLDKHRQR